MEDELVVVFGVDELVEVAVAVTAVVATVALVVLDELPADVPTSGVLCDILPLIFLDSIILAKNAGGTIFFRLTDNKEINILSKLSKHPLITRCNTIKEFVSKINKHIDRNFGTIELFKLPTTK